MALGETAIKWAGERGISQATLERLGVASGMASMPGEPGRCEAIAFPYRRGDQVVNVKYRSLNGKGFKQKEGGELRFWNLDHWLSEPTDQVYIVEGEMDAAALVEAGLSPSEALSVPNGAPMKSSECPEELDRYRYVIAALEEGLSAAKKIILATDNDPKGRALRQDLVQLFGPARCSFIEWPEGIKDANDFLDRHGAADLAMFLREDVREWPVEGLYSLSEIPEPPPLTVWRPGFPEWESKLGFAEGTLSVATGHPGHGKTTLMMQLWYQIARDYEINGAIASFETRAKPYHRRNIRQFIHGAPEASLSQEQKSGADAWMENHLKWILHPNRRPSLKFVLDMAEAAVVRKNARFLVIDPWNTLENDRPERMRETDWIGDCLDYLLDFARDMRCHVQVIAHPSKSSGQKTKGTRPELEDIAGSKHWDNKCDLGVCVHRPKMFEDGQRKTDCHLWVLKARYEELGYPCKLSLDFRLNEGRYVATDYETVM